MRMLAITFPLLLLVVQTPAIASETTEVLFRDARIFDGRNSTLTPATDVLVRGNLIAAIGHDLEATNHTRVISAEGRTLMPGLIDVHVHMTFSALGMAQLMSPELSPALAEKASSEGAEAMLLRDFHCRRPR